jgi:hypothetical protein
MVIGISGRLGSGKDTVGEIIQYLTGVDADGKFSKGLNWSYSSNFEIKKFAGKLKIIGSMLSGVPVEYFEDQDFKKLPMGLEWEMTYREFLQKLGTEAMRDGLHKEVWVNALFADYKAMPNKTIDESFMEQFVTGSSSIHYKYPNWVITDMRFPNEIAAVELREGITIRVNRSFNHKMGSKETGTIDLTPLHPSETALDDAKFDYVIDNDGTLDELVEKVRVILTKEKII